MLHREKRRNDKDNEDLLPSHSKKRKIEEKLSSIWKFNKSTPTTPESEPPSLQVTPEPSKIPTVSSDSAVPSSFFKKNDSKSSLTRSYAKRHIRFLSNQSNSGTIDVEMGDEPKDEITIKNSPAPIPEAAKQRKGSHVVSPRPISQDNIKTIEEFNNFYQHKEITINPSTKRDHVAYEILTTEDTYVRLLQTGDLVYNYHLEKWAKCLTSVEANILSSFFASFRDIINVNSILLNSMRERFSKWTQYSTLGDIIGTLAPFLKTYKNYAELYEHALYAIDHFKNKEPNGSFIQLLRTGEVHPLSQGYKIDSILILPIQRVPRYVLLLKELISLTTPDHPDFASLQTASAKIEVIAQDINKSIKEAESRDYCIQIQQKLDTKFGTVALPISNLVEAHRRFVREGNVIKCGYPNERQNKKLFLFNDILLMCTALSTFRSGKFSVDHTFFLERTSVASPVTPDTFELRDDTQHCIFLVESSEAKQDWLVTLGETITLQKVQHEENRTRGIVFTRDLMAKEQVFNEATKCTVCQKDFSFFFSTRKKHLCRMCYHAVCTDCSDNRAGETRICDTCWTKSASGFLTSAMCLLKSID